MTRIIERVGVTLFGIGATAAFVAAGCIVGFDANPLWMAPGTFCMALSLLCAIWLTVVEVWR